MKQELIVQTDCASISVFDPGVIDGYPGEDLERFDLHKIDGIRQGQFFGFFLGGDGVYKIQLTMSIEGPERDYACARMDGLGLRCVSGSVCAGGYGFEGDAADFPSFLLDPGWYEATVYEILWNASPVWWSEDGSVSPEAPADYVIELTPVVGERTLERNLQTLRLDTLFLPSIDGPPSFLFPSKGRRIGTEIGAIYTSTVIKSPKAPNGFRLKACGIEGYRVELSNYEDLQWKDRVSFRGLEIDHDEGLFKGEFVSKH